MNKMHAVVATAIGLSTYGISVWATYHPLIRTTRLYWLIGLSAALIGHVLWAYLARKLNDVGVFKFALVWDAGFTLVSLLVPMLLFQLRVNYLGIFGVFLICLGGFIVKEFGFEEKDELSRSSASAPSRPSPAM